jgi:hypothetical protein
MFLPTTLLPTTHWIIGFLFILLSGCCRSPQQLADLRACKAEEDKESLNENIDLPDHCLTLNDIIEITLRNNLDLAVKAQQYAIQRETVTRTALNMLPQLNVNMDWSYRNNSPAATGLIVTDTKPPFPPIQPEVTSQRRTYQWNIGLLWNLLDFGLSYFRSQIECDRLVVSAMDYERTRQNLILNAVRIYWRAIIAKKAVEIAAPFMVELTRQRLILENFLEHQFYLSKDQIYAKLNRFYQREFQLSGFNDRTDSSDPTQGYAKEYENALLDLSSLMGIRAGVQFELCQVDDFPFKLDFGDINTLEETALLNRPEHLCRHFARIAWHPAF